jgi:hypothetical protein
MSATSQVISAAPKELPRPNRMRAFFRNRVGLIGASMILLTVLVAVAAPLISPSEP